MQGLIRPRNIPVKYAIPVAYLPNMHPACDHYSMNNVARFRKIRGLSQYDLAEMVGVKQPHISRIERGDDGPPLRLFKQIADALEVSVSDLLSDDRSPAEAELLRIFRSLPEDRQRGWIEMAEALSPDLHK